MEWTRSSGSGRSVPTDRRVAVDTSVVVNLLTAGAGDEDPDWLRHSAWVFRAAEVGVHQLLVPAIVLAEVAGSGKVRGNQLSTGERKRRLTAATTWLTQGRFTVVDIDERMGRRAADLAIEHQLKGADACIVAAAQLTRCATLYSWDADHTKLDGKIPGLTITHPRERELQQTTTDDETA